MYYHKLYSIKDGAVSSGIDLSKYKAAHVQKQEVTTNGMIASYPLYPE